jgi:hypothetical protein
MKPKAGEEHWVTKHWRPMMGWSYLLTCTFDFIIFPILWSMLQSYQDGTVTLQWQPLTLQGAGLYHLAMGAIMGITSYGRTQEKMNLNSNAGTTYVPPNQGQVNVSNQPTYNTQPQYNASTYGNVIHTRKGPPQTNEPEL